MAKQIAHCSDGTWDTSSNKTNVYRMYKALPVNSGQVTFYDDGVGTMGTILERLLGAAFGKGLFDNIKQAYAQIGHVYEEGDRIFLFGFSRGAYTARSLAGMIAACGLPGGSFDDKVVETAFEAYRHKDRRAQLLASLKASQLSPVKLTMVGVWETVGALGIPGIVGGVSPLTYGFLDTNLNPNVLNAYHAVAIDEKRWEFPPTLWTSKPVPGQTMEQVWFCGVHGDVGGGYPPDAGGSESLSDVTLTWMMDKAASHGLQIADEIRKQYAFPLASQYALGRLHESWNPLWGVPRMREIAKDAWIADSVMFRCRNDTSWRPKNLNLVNGLPVEEYAIAKVLSDSSESTQLKDSVA